MDVGARAGYYTQKSAKQLLLEWAQGAKRIKPRYKSKGGDGGYTAKVVLPGSAPGGADDVVAFTPKGVMYETADAAEQAAAVAGLHAVAGDRALHRVLPAEHRAQWDAATELSASRKERDAARAVAAAARAAQEKRAAASAAARAPTRVVMTDAQRASVAGALASVRGIATVARPAGDGDGADIASVAAQLTALGFAASDADEAAASSPAPGLAAALDWACLHLDEGALPPAFGPGAAGKPVAVLVNATTGGVDKRRERPPPPDDSPDVASLMVYGYAAVDVVRALEESRGDVDASHAALFERLVGPPSAPADATDISPDDADDEVAALEAIYGDDVAVARDARSGGRVVDLAVEAAAGAPVSLRVWLPPTYPAAPPSRWAVRREGAPGALLRGLTAAVAAEAASLAGCPCVHGLVAAVAAALDDEAALVAAGAAVVAPRAARQAPADGGAAADAAGRLLHARSAPHPGRRGGRPGARPLDPAALAAESALLRRQSAARATTTEPRAAAMRASRASLPAFKQRDELLAAIHASRVAFVAGETGCGKSTQVPQYVLEAAIDAGHGASTNILVAQPRRVAAVGLAQRVAAERGEAVGDVVGYSVRLDTKASARTRLTFCTTGVLLRRLLDGGFASVTHVVLDEVHERSLDCDLALLLLKRLLAASPASSPRVVLMSATADAATFGAYFEPAAGRAGVVAVPGFTHPVRDLFLEDALEATRTVIARGSRHAKKGGKGGGRGKEKPPAPVAAAAAAPDSWDAGATPPPSPSPSSYSDETLRSLALVDESVINYDLVAAVVAHALRAEAADGPGALLRGWPDAPSHMPPGPPGAILVFMPGAPEIGRAVRAIEGSQEVRKALAGAALRVVPLHGGLSPAAQALAFDRPPPSCRKIVVSTNVAETSVTIDDVTTVVDSGRVKEMAHDAEAGIGRLVETWVSRAAAKQRRGRAGRVRPGACFKLFSRAAHAKLAADTKPEVLRSPLEGLCLSLRTALPASVSLADGAEELVTPPDAAALRGAVHALTRLGALDAHECLTPLGLMLARLPMDARLGKALVYACLLRCAGPVLTVAAALSTGRALFAGVPPEKRAAADAARRRLCATSVGARSDHVSMVEAFNAWDAAAAAGGRGAARALAGDMFLADGALDAAKAARGDLARTLADLGLLPGEYAAAARRWGTASGAVEKALARAAEAARAGGRASGGADGAPPPPSPLDAGLPPLDAADAASHSARVVKAALCAGFAPAGLLRVEAPAQKFKAALGGAIEVDADPSSLKFRDEKGARVFLHPSSLCFPCGRFDSGWLVASGVVAVNGKPSARCVSMAPAYAVLLFGGSLDVRHAAGEVVMDGWARFAAPARIAVLVREVRAAADAALLAKLEGGGGGLVGDPPIVGALHRLLETDGF